ncbi:hypothetical protein R70723_26300 [Paenibacillus sp. FSL R7-0273]|uniref:hypothetical protein n=1 Tax=Paenibacillus sp. FSL R7-0273 TaxID=1536772 RepID=UPI0004F6101D|nr:hypothetical protein [Paenibacillus sp. FSL R7-0273]AIQ49021.1 hypothetical protein R70723_26300 [Paenibacillus sp. FSL R7-0273]OMF90636.1 hypothetical protein BK144_17355 [Paenibacillus sp. FSL R7-0273]
MLESERYGEAMELLRFLLQCQGQEERHYEEWQSLLDWLEAAFPYDARSNGADHAESGEEQDLKEEDMARILAKSKLEEDAGYPDKLLRKVMQEPLSEGTILALEQLSYLEGSHVDDTLTNWLQKTPVHPLLQFRTLQTLKKRGVQGVIRLARGSELAQIEIEAVPLQNDDFPPQVAQVMERVAEQAEVHEPTLYYFAQELWGQFMMSIYGSGDYRKLLDGGDDLLDIWAGALHQLVSESLNGTRQEEETRAMYGITDSMRFQFEGAYRSLRGFVKSSILDK